MVFWAAVFGVAIFLGVATGIRVAFGAAGTGALILGALTRGFGMDLGATGAFRTGGAILGAGGGGVNVDTGAALGAGGAIRDLRGVAVATLTAGFFGADTFGVAIRGAATGGGVGFAVADLGVGCARRTSLGAVMVRDAGAAAVG
ncbi:MAG: hypothetical protein JKY20_11095, partial [Alphaproteobacteria bacterium]|nr:hypothetical protein [Alphaproteobacteria bacterium]